MIIKETYAITFGGCGCNAGCIIVLVIGTRQEYVYMKYTFFHEHVQVAWFAPLGDLRIHLVTTVY
jgi:hypothetical protein